MEKPTIFFSHSSKDQEPLQHLRSLVLEITGNAVDIFVSSDGQSIRLGKNWVHEVEKGLERCKLMFVFVTVNSVGSNWIHFESGFVYAKGIQVIPVGLGVDLATVKPPLGLLQGFNIRGPEGLNNIIATINREFHFTFPEQFNAENSEPIFKTDGGIHSNVTAIDEFVDSVDFGVAVADPEKALDAVKEVLEEANCNPQRRATQVESYGAVFQTQKRSDNTQYLTIRLDGRSMTRYFSAIQRIIQRLDPDSRDVGFYLRFRPGIAEETRRHRVTSLLYQSGVTIRADVMLTYAGIVFAVSHSNWPPDRRTRTVMQGSCACTDLPTIPLVELIMLLLERQVLTFDAEGASTSGSFETY